MLYSSMTCWWRKKEVHTINQRRACKLVKYWGIYTHIHTRYKRHVSAHACITSGSVTMPTYGRTGESSCTWINYVNKQAIKSRAAKYQASDRLLPQHESKPNQETSRPSQIATKQDRLLGQGVRVLGNNLSERNTRPPQQLGYDIRLRWPATRLNSAPIDYPAVVVNNPAMNQAKSSFNF